MKTLALKGLALALIVVGIIWAWNHYIGGVKATADAAGYTRRDTEQKNADNKALKEALDDVARLNKLIQGISENEKRERETAAVAAAAARDAGVRLRAAESRLRATIAAKSCPGAAAANGGASTDAAADLLADVQRRLDDATDRIAGFADQGRRTGLACERIHDALK